MIYIDTGYLIALLIKGEPHHERALALDAEYEARGVTFLTTVFVISEMMAHFSRDVFPGRSAAARLTRKILGDDRWRIVEVDFEMFLRALQLCENRPDKRYSLVDCIGMTVMQEAKIAEVLATDADFEQEGLVNLMRLRGR